jgi:biotin operon repressor
MARSDRLFRLLQALRSLPAPVTAATLAQETGVSVRSIYRDIESLRVAGAEIGGERGYGYCLIEDGTLPPQMFNRIEIEALVLGLAEVRQMGDPALATAAAAVLGKVAATLPSVGQQHLLHAVSQVHRFEERYPVLAGYADHPRGMLARGGLADPLFRSGGRGYRQNHLAAGHRLFRQHAGGAGLVLSARGLPNLSHRTDHGRKQRGDKFPAAAGGAAAHVSGAIEQDVIPA